MSFFSNKELFMYIRWNVVLQKHINKSRKKGTCTFLTKKQPFGKLFNLAD